MSVHYEEVKTFIVTEKKGESTYTYLVLRKENGTEVQVDIFSGGGYVEQLQFSPFEPVEAAPTSEGKK